jgi:hypothetical protein
MRLLIVTWYFPPSNTIGAIRLGAFAAYMAGAGHDVRVLTAKNPPYEKTLRQDLDEGLVLRANWRDVNWLQTAAATFIKKNLPAAATGSDDSARHHQGMRGPGEQAGGHSAGEHISWKKEILSSLLAYYHAFANWPDGQIGWFPEACLDGWKLLRRWRPDLIFASGPPFTGLLVGTALGAAASLPVVLEYRDRWSDDPYYPSGSYRKRWNSWVEAALAKRASALVTVSQPWADAYQQRYGKAVATVYNGYNAEPPADDACRGRAGQAGLHIGYFGWIYHGYRDPSPVFEALVRLKDVGSQIRITFYGTSPTHVTPLAARYGVTASIEVKPRVSHAESLNLQRTFDVLLLMQWNDPQEEGNIPAKLFEYIGSRRPILGIGLETGLPARIIADRGAGFFGNNPDAIAEQLRRWLYQKESQGIVPSLPLLATTGLSRREQFAALETFLATLPHVNR